MGSQAGRLAALERQYDAAARATAPASDPPTFEETWAALGWTPQPRQQRAIRALTEDAADIVVYGGAAGGGKSSLMRNLEVAICRRWSGVRCCLLRRTYAELRDNHERPIVRLETLGFGRLFKNDRIFEFRNGSLLQLAYFDSDDDVDRYQGIAFNVMGFDEATKFSWYQLTKLQAWNRRPEGSDVSAPIFVMLATNPGGPSHTQVKETFIDAAPSETVFEARIEERRARAVFIPAKVTDNDWLMAHDPEYLERLNALPEDERKALRDGDWDVFAGQYFREWRRDKHVVVPFGVPVHWRRWGALDWGYAKPLAYGVFAQDPDTDRIYLVRELYQAGLRNAEAIARVKAIEAGDALDGRYADPSMWIKGSNDTGRSTAEEYGAAGLALQPATNDRIVGWRRVHDVLADGPDGVPMFQVFANCTEFIRSFPALVHDRSRPEDVDTDGEDHAADMVRYGLVARIGTRPRAQARAESQPSAWMQRGENTGMDAERAWLRSRR